MKALIIIILIVYMLGAFLTLLTIILEKVYKKRLKKVRVSKWKNIYVLLPALKEQKIVKQTLEHFSKVKYKGNIQFIVITSEKEEAEYRKLNIKDKTTNVLVDEEIARLNDKRFIHLHYPKTNGNKSSQLNYALDYIDKKKIEQKNTYISVFDFDSEPDLNTFTDLNKVAILRNNPNAILQIPLCCKNFAFLSKKTKNILIILYSLQHTIRSCAVEKMKILLCSLTNMKVPQYFMGACMHLRMDTLMENDKFPFVDDLTLGYRYSIQNLNFAYLPNKNFTLIYNNVFDYMNSATLIFKGISTYISEIKRASKNYWGKFKMFIAGTGNILIFTVVPYIIIIYYIISIINREFTLLFFLMFSTHYLWSISSYIIFRTNGVKTESRINLIFSIIISPIWQLFRPSGFLIYFKRFIVSKIKKESISNRKTER